MEWTLDTTHSSVSFAVRHMGIASVRGQFRDFDASIRTEDGALAGLDATIRTASVDTGEAQRDGHLRSEDFFAAEAHPEMRFRSTTIERVGDDRYRVEGELTIRGVTKPVTFETEVTEPITDPWGNRRAAATAKGELNRKDWGLEWNQVLEAGSLLVGEKVRFTLDVQAIVPAAEQEAVGA